MVCAICGVRRPRRYCPGVRGDICSICCGTEREVTVNCPLDCQYLRDAREHERLADVDPSKFPNQDIPVTERFLNDHEELLVFLGRAVAQAGLETPGAVDYDVRDALEALIRTYRTLRTGLYYESRPENLVAGNIYSSVQDALQERRAHEAEQVGTPRTRDSDVLGVLAFLQRLELDRNNGRKRGRAFLDFLRGFYPHEDAIKAVSPLIVP
jgi:hypothetical protein